MVILLETAFFPSSTDALPGKLCFQQYNQDKPVGTIQMVYVNPLNTLFDLY